MPEARCSTCASALRDHAHRLVCDQCNAMLITDADFAAAVDELDGSNAKLVTLDEHPQKPTCPRCGGPTTSCSLAIGPTELPGHYLRCATHGVWMPQEVMAAVFARASRRAHLGAGVGRTYGGVIAAPIPPGGSGGVAGVGTSLRDAFGSGQPADAALGISSGVGISHVHTVFVSAYKNRALACAVCPETPLVYQGDRWFCPSCGGAFVESAALVGMVEEITKQPFEQHAAPATPSAHACPLCSAPMVVDALEGHAVERCAAHGTWFGAHVLAAALEDAASPHQRDGWLHRLLHRRR